MKPPYQDIPGNEHAFQQLQEVLASEKAIAFVGAGASAGLYPLWDQLIRRLADEAFQQGVGDDADRDYWLQRCVTRPQQAVRGIKQALQEGPYCGLIRDMFGPQTGPDGRRFTAVQEALLKLPFRGYVTTNYDPGLLEARQAIRSDAPAAGYGTWRDAGLVNRWITGDVFDEASSPVMFLHGYHDRCDSIVLGAGEYRQAYYQDAPFRELLGKLWTQERLVFVGFGFSDAWMSFVAGELLDRVRARTSDGPRHIAIVGLTADEQYTPQLRRDEQDEYNARLLTYPVHVSEDGGQDHGALVELLEKALSAVGDKPTPKAETRSTKPSTSTKPSFPIDYRDWLERQCSDIDVVGLRLKEVRPIKLNHVYVPLTTPAVREFRRAKKPKRAEISEQEPKAELLLNRLNDQSLYVSGPPGAGKSTFCRWAAWLVCKGALPTEPEEQADDFREQFPEALQSHLPVLVRLRDFWTYLPQDTSQELSTTQLGKSLQRWLADKEPGGLAWEQVEAHLENGTALVIFDGVDEVPLSHEEANSTWYPRALLLSGLGEAIAKWSSIKGNRLLVTSRPYGLNEAERQKLGLQEARIDELPEPHRHLLARRWFRILVDGAASGDALAEDMLAHIQQRSGIDQLTSNPMLLTAMCVIYREGKRLPQDKCDLYGRIVDNVLYNRIRDPARIEMARNELRVVAHGMHTGQAVGQDRANPEAEVSCEEIDRILESYRQQSRWTQAGFEGVVASRELLLSQSGLLLPRSDQRAAFYHFSIREFLAAERLSGTSDEVLTRLFQQRAQVPEWHNTLSFLFGSVQNASVDRSVHLVEALLEKVAADELGLQVVIGDALQMLLAKNIRLQPEREDGFRQRYLSAIEREVSLRERNLLGLALGHVGDPRIMTDLRKQDAYVQIPAGDYAYQDDRQTIEEPFLLAKYPVTNSQFELFIKDDGYDDQTPWSEEGWLWREREKVSEPGLWRDAQWNAPNQPVVGVSFYEAEAFCKWAGGFLPSERQWEAAARGSQGLKYPWGPKWEDGICNSYEAGIGTTSPVGLFPRSKSRSFGLEDMAGNVWEWCDSRWSDNSASRVLRGGAFFNRAAVARSVNRFNYRPVLRNYRIGFRAARTYP